MTSLIDMAVNVVAARQRLLATLPHEPTCDMGQLLGEVDTVDLKCFCLTAQVTSDLMCRFSRHLRSEVS